MTGLSHTLPTAADPLLPFKSLLWSLKCRRSGPSPRSLGDDDQIQMRTQAM